MPENRFNALNDVANVAVKLADPFDTNVLFTLRLFPRDGRLNVRDGLAKLRDKFARRFPKFWIIRNFHLT